MSAPFLPVVSAAPTSPPASPVVHPNRNLANFPPNSWGDLFLTIDPDLKMNFDSVHNQIEELKGKVNMMIAATHHEKKLHMIDQIQRLGLAYHFEKEIDAYIKEIKNLYFENEGSASLLDHLDLYTTSLLFRLLRQQGYMISPDIFEKFKDGSTGRFKDSLTDTRGLLSLYEASHLRVHGEDILQEAFAFSVSRLEIFMKQYNEKNHENDGSSLLVSTEGHSLATQVGHALERCLWKGLARTEARFHISVYEEESCHSEELLTLAKLDFNFLQKQHLKEIHGISRWWKEKDIIRRFPFARDRLVEAYYWSLATYFEPQYALARDIFAKFVLFVTVLDDIYDAYGTLEELQLLTDAIQRWDIGTMNQLPEYMQVFYKGLLDFFDEIEEKLAHMEGKCYRMYYVKEAMKFQARAYFEEVKWLNKQKIPTMEEYLSIGLPSSANMLFTIVSFLGMGEVATEYAFKWSFSRQNKVIKALELIGRVSNDIASHKFEQERAHLASAVECFMIENGVSEQKAVEELWNKVDDAWIDINEECIQSRSLSDPLITRILNYTRSMILFYKDDRDNYTSCGIKMKQQVTALIVDPIPI